MVIITESFISLIICTRNRASQLTAALVELNKIEYTKKYEIILVDNGSTDSTRTVIAKFIKEHTAPFKYIYEAKAGLSRARNAGLSHAKGDIVAFTDDDCYPTIDFLSSISKCFEDQTISYSGGRVLLFDQSDRRITIQEKNSYEVLEPLTYIAAGLIHGANISFRRDTILELKGFDERLGTGTQFKSGEDTDILRRFSAFGYKGVYDPAITVFHHHGRKTLEEETKLMGGYDRGNAACMLKYTMHGKLRRLYIKHWYWMLRKASFRIKTRHVCYAVLFYIKYGPSFLSVFKHPHDCLSNEESYKD